MSKVRIYARNLAANWIGHGASLGVMFFLSPFIVHTLGMVEYGIWSLMVTVTGYLGILDLGIRASTGRHIALYLGREDHRAVDGTVRTSLGVIAAASAAMLAAGVVLGFAFPRIFPDTPARYHGLVKVLLPLLALGMGTSALGAAFSSVLAAHERFDLLQAVNLAVLALRTAGTVVLLMGGYGIVGLSVLAVACNAVALLGNGLLAKRVYPALRIWPLEFSRVRLKELFGYGTAAFISGISYRVIHQTDLIVVGLLVGVAFVTTYSIAGMLVLYTWGFIELISRTVFPSLQRAAGRGEEGAVQWLYLRQGRVVLAAGIPVYVGFIVFGERFIRLWMGPEFAPAATVLTILSAAKLYSLLKMPAGAVLASLGHVRANAGLAAAEAALNLGLSVLFVMVFGWGLAGIAAGTLVALMVTSGTFIPVLACRRSRLRMWQLARETVLPAVVAAGLFGAWCWAVRNWIPADSWPLFAAQVALALAGYAPVCLLALVPVSDRQRLFGVLRARLWGAGACDRLIPSTSRRQTLRVLYYEGAYESSDQGIGGSRTSLANLIAGFNGKVEAYVVCNLPIQLRAQLPPNAQVIPFAAGRSVQRAQQGGLLARNLWWWGGFLAVAGRLVMLILRCRIQVVHTNNQPTANAPAILAALVTGRPCVAHLRGTQPPRWETRWLFHYVAHYIAISDDVNQYFAKRGLLRGAPVSIVYNGLDVNGLRLRCTRVARNDGRFRVGLLGRVDPYKGHEFFLRVAKETLRRSPGVEFIVHGPIPRHEDAAYLYYERLCDLRQQWGLEKVVRFAGPYSDVAAVMAQVHVVLCCSPYSNFGRVLYEAMACGVPVVAFDSGGTREVAVHGENCLLVRNGDTQAMAQAMLALRSNADLSERLAWGGLSTAAAHFDRHRNASRVWRIYRRLLCGGACP